MAGVLDSTARQRVTHHPGGAGVASPRRLGSLIVVLAVALLGSCAGSATPGPTSLPSPAAGQAVLDAMSGQVQAPGGASIARGPVSAGTTLVTGATSWAHLVLGDGSRVRMGSSTRLTLVSLPGGPAGPSVTRLRMEAGSGWFVLVGAGPMEVELPFGLSSVTGSTMTIAIDQFGRSTTTCVEGHCQVQNAAGALSLTAARQGSMMAVAVPPIFEGAVEIEPCDPMSPDCTPGNTPGPTDPPTPTPRPATPASSRTPAPTLFVLPSGATPTPVIPGIADLPTPNPSAPVGPDGLSPEERANQGSHAYQFGCQSYNRCECNMEAVGQTMTITFAPGKSATLASGGESITYERVGPSTYRWASGSTFATITFSLLGWTFDTRKDGQTCAVQTFRLP